MQNWQKYFSKTKVFIHIHHGWLILFLVGLIFIFGYRQGMRFEKERGFNEERQISQMRQNGNSFKFINPLLECESFSEGNFIRSKELESSMQKMIASVSRDPDVEHLSIYFRDLNNGPWMGFNESEKFSPASLLKVPIMMAYLKKAENDLAFLKKEIIYKEDYQEKKFIGNVESGVRLIENEKYSIEELLKDMIVYSDNDSARILLENIDQSFLEKIYTDLTLPIPGKSKEVENFMTVKEYASFFRILYNASYLNREMSEKALEILSWSDFKDGLLAGVPNDIKVAHKFGERSLDNTVQLHDCGIIYNKEKPYLLCVMTRGKKFEKLKWVIRIVSEKVWEETQKQ